MKRAFDLFVSYVLIICLIPVILMIALLVKIKLGSPVLFKQERPGLNGKPFNLYKFRTMNGYIDRNGKLLSDEERLTSFGIFLRKCSLDELPQLINVIKGDISLVGPRPLLMEYLSLYSERHARRHEVRPGITGWAQVNGRNSVSWKEKLDMDVWYVENQSFFLDMKILFLTVVKVVKTEGVNQAGKATVEKYRG